MKEKDIKLAPQEANSIAYKAAKKRHKLCLDTNEKL